MNKLSGYEFLYGIPGTIGGAVYMNAGAFGQEILQHVYSVDLIDDKGIIHRDLKSANIFITESKNL